MFLPILLALFKILGSLGVFLVGMKIMSEGIQKVAGDRLRQILTYMTQNRFAGALTGFITTCLVQSSSATTVMVISFVNARLLTLFQAIGVIMGANIGTTVTIWMIVLFGYDFDIEAFALPSIAIGLPLIFSKITKRKNIGEIFVGFGLLFLGLNFLKDSVPDIEGNQAIYEMLSSLSHSGVFSLLIFTVIGIILTVIVQSSSAAMAITVAMAAGGWLDFSTAAALVLGQNIGTTVTAYLASINANYHAKRAARAHMIFNVFGVVWMILLFKVFVGLIDAIVPGDLNFNKGGADFDIMKYHLAMFHTMFNIINVLLLIWFVPQIENIVKKMVKPKKNEKEVEYSLEYFSTNIQPTPEIGIIEAKKEVFKMSNTVNDFLAKSEDIFTEGKNIISIEEAKKREALTDQMQEQISNYLAECTKHELSSRSAKDASDMIRIVNELESIGDSTLNLFLINDKLGKNALDSEIKEQILELFSKVNKFIDWNHSFIVNNIEAMSVKDLEKSIMYENEIDDLRNKFIDSSSRRLSKDSNSKTELIFIDIIKHLEHIGDFALNISQALED